MSARHWPFVAVVLLLAGCTTSSGGRHATPTAPTTATPPGTLVAYDSCGELLTELRAATAQTVGPYGLAGDGPVPLALPPDAKAAAGEKVPAAAAPAYSGTNVAEAGVDEPDIVKTDGRRIVTVGDGVLRIVDPASRRQTGRLDLGGTRQAQLLLAGDRALVLFSDGMYPLLGPRPFRPSSGQLEIVLVDLTGTPRVISRYRGDGRLVDARQTGSVVRVVLSSTPRITFPFRATSTDGLLRENRAAVAAAPITAWLPSWTVTTGNGTTGGRLGCGSVSRPAHFSGTRLLSVLTFDLTAAALDAGDPVGIVADGDAVYATPTSLYVANDPSWRLNVGEPQKLGPPPETEIFRFATTAKDRPVFEASGAVPGTILNQYAMSEWDGYLRVATTAGSSSSVRILTAKAGKLIQVGSVDGLGRGERIYSVRFLGPRAYVVTFQQTDPLYSLDLTDPRQPRVTGALTITGYSAHLQPVGDGRLIGIGQEASVQGRQLGTQISLFDVTDSANPRLLTRQQVPDGFSEAEFDPHALLWWPAAQLLVVPIADPTSDGALALRVGAETLRPVARVEPPGAGAESTGSVRRELVVGDTLWTVTDTGLLASSVSTLDRIAWVPLS